MLNHFLANTTVASLNRRSRKLGGEDEGHEEPYTDQRRADVDIEEETETHNGQEAELSTQAISFVPSPLPCSTCLAIIKGINLQSLSSCSELETDITTFIRNSGKNDGWPSAFQKQVRERGEELQEKLRIGVAKRFSRLSFPSPVSSLFFLLLLLAHIKTDDLSLTILVSERRNC